MKGLNARSMAFEKLVQHFESAVNDSYKKTLHLIYEYMSIGPWYRNEIYNIGYIFANFTLMLIEPNKLFDNNIDPEHIQIIAVFTLACTHANTLIQYTYTRARMQ